MWSTLLSLLPVLLPPAITVFMTWFQYKILNIKTQADLDAALVAYAQAKTNGGNESADDRSDVQNQKDKLEQIKKDIV